MRRWLDGGNGEMNMPWNFTLRTGMETRAMWAGAPNIIMHDDGQYVSTAQRDSWFSNFKYGQTFRRTWLAHSPARPLARSPALAVPAYCFGATSKLRYTKCVLSVLMTENSEFRNGCKIRGIPKKMRQLVMIFFHRESRSVLKDTMVTYCVTFKQ